MFEGDELQGGGESELVVGRCRVDLDFVIGFRDLSADVNRIHSISSYFTILHFVLV